MKKSSGQFSIWQTEKVNNNFALTSVIGYSGDDLLDKLNNYDSNIENKFYPKRKADYQKFVRELFTNAESPYRFESEIASLISNHMMDDFGLPRQEFDNMVLSYFRKYAANKKLDENTWMLFHSCKRTHRVDMGNSTFTRTEEIIEDAKLVMAEVVSNDLNQFLLEMIHPEIFKKESFSVSQFALTLYDTWPRFKEILYESDETKWSYLREFKEFFAVFEAKDFAVYVPFDFKEIPIHIRTGKA
ncbi:hypothetical protein [Chryseolinea lacunae]|uniref:Uncharacterized protein n=1 Tax=Chryseolinea lacunae TaxID=2801331 RepID=A0ABS1KVA1_9BACT|nr:hypothetical protein [Chryseolinea lacunae]MBL0742627.1 hypothetical protein [Chryseolinea lacunae]